MKKCKKSKLAKCKFIKVEYNNDYINKSKEWFNEHSYKDIAKINPLRVYVNYIRHELSSYDNAINICTNKKCIRRRIYNLISIIYPELTIECEIQKELKI